MKTPQAVFEALLKARGLSDEADRSRFLHPEYSQHSHDPYKLRGMSAAVARIIKARDRGEVIGIFGDYDIDGLTATTLLSEALEAFGLEVVAHIPNRFIEGYGLSADGLEHLKSKGVSLVITVDCGSTAVNEVAYAAELGLEVIVTDHHEVPKILPDCVAVINPKRADSDYPFKDLAGVGVAFKLVQALQQRLTRPGAKPVLELGQEKWLLDLVALGTVCDVVSLSGENRMLVYWGLQVARQTRRPGLQALAVAAGVDLATLDSLDFGFRFGPRLNASGRLESALLSLSLLQSGHPDEAAEIAEQLEAMNSQRRSLQDAIYRQSLEQAADFKDDQVLVLSGDGWAEGVVGIVASKIMEATGKPAFIISKLADGTAKGSARGFGDYSVVSAIRANEDLLIKGGGHQYAGGLSLPAENIEAFRRGVNEQYKTLGLSQQHEHLLKKPDIVLPTVQPLSLELVELLEQLGPFGMGNPEPLFALPPVTVANRRLLGAEGKHLRLELTDGQVQLEAIGFGMGEQQPEVGERIQPVVRVQKNTFRGQTRLQLQLVRLRSDT